MCRLRLGWSGVGSVRVDPKIWSKTFTFAMPAGSDNRAHRGRACTAVPARSSHSPPSTSKFRSLYLMASPAVSKTCPPEASLNVRWLICTSCRNVFSLNSLALSHSHAGSPPLTLTLQATQLSYLPLNSLYGVVDSFNLSRLHNFYHHIHAQY